MKEAQGWLNQNPFWVSNICRVETIFLLAAHICSILKTGNYHLRWWDAIHTATMLAGCPGSPCAALSVTVSVLIYAKARSGRWRRDPIWTGSQQSLNSILWVEYFDRVLDFQVLVLVIALVAVLIVFVAGFFSNKLFYFFVIIIIAIFPSLLLSESFVVSGPVLTLSSWNKWGCASCTNLL